MSKYMFLFEFDYQMLKQLHPTGIEKTYADMKQELKNEGFGTITTNVFLGSVPVVDAVVAFQKLNKKFSWFFPCIKSAKLLRIEEEADLMPAILLGG